MRRRFLPFVVTVALCAPSALAVVAASSSAGAISTTAAWTDMIGNWDRSSSPTIADVNGDGVSDIVVGNQDGYLRVLSGKTGGNLPGWPQPVIVAGRAVTAVDSTPAVGDLFKNGKKEIVVGAGSTFYRQQQGGVVVFNANGSVSCRFRTRDDANLGANTSTPDGYSEGVFSSPAIGDIDGDGYPDIVFGALDRHIYAINRFCHPILDLNVEDTVWSSPALYDINGDGRLDILIGGDQTAGGFDNWSGGEFRAIEWTPSGPLVAWEKRINDTVWSSPAVGDIDGDGRVEVVVGAGHFYNRSDTNKLFAWHADDGSTVRGWPVTTGGATSPSPALGDLNGDGRPEVVASSRDGVVRAYWGNGTLMWARGLTFNHVRRGGPASSPIIADMNGDGHNDVGAGNDWGYTVMDGRNGAVLADVNTFYSYENAGAVGNFGTGAGWRLITAGFDTPHHRTRIQAFDIPTPKTPPPWPMFRRDPAHVAGPVGRNLLPPGYCRRPVNPPAHPNAASSQGYWVLGVDGAVFSLKGAPFFGNARGRVRGPAVAIAATHSGNGYYILDAAGDIFPFGDARSYGSMAGHRLNAPIIALAPTPTGRGYWLLGRDGGVFSFGDARFYGSMGNRRLNAPIISIAATTSGRGYWMLASDGGVFSFGDARFHGSTGNLRLAAPVISMATAPSGAGYWLVARDGGIFSFGVPFYGSVPGIGLCRGAAGMQIRPTVTGKGYFVVAFDGRVFPFGDALGGASAPPLSIWNFATDLAVRR